MITNQNAKCKMQNAKCNFITSLSVILISGFSFNGIAQTNTLPSTGNVGIGTTSPSTRLQVNGTARIDSSLIVKDSVVFQKTLRVTQDAKFLGNIGINGLTKINGDLKFTSLESVANLSNKNFVLTNSNGLTKQIGFEEFKTLMIDATYAPKFCDGITVIPNPTWANGPDKIYSECPQVKVGIGTNSPTHGLHVTTDGLFNTSLEVKQSLTVGASGVSTFSKFNLVNLNRTVGIQLNTVGNLSLYQRLLFFEYDNPDTKILEVVNTATNRKPIVLLANGELDIDNGVNNILHLGTNGMFKIGNGTIETFRVEADGLTRARKIKVDTQVWPDYVFDSTYYLMPLSDLEQYILLNKHLPNVPSQEQVVEEGVDIAEMNVVLMEKVEELTRYLLQQQKEIEELKKRMTELQGN